MELLGVRNPSAAPYNKHHSAYLNGPLFCKHIDIYLFFIIIDRFELLCCYITWKLFWQICYRNDTLPKCVPNSCCRRWDSNSHHTKAVQSWKPLMLSARLLTGYRYFMSSKYVLKHYFWKYGFRELKLIKNWIKFV